LHPVVETQRDNTSPTLNHSHKMTSVLRNWFGGQGQSSKPHTESRSRSRQAPAVDYSRKSSKPATSNSAPSRSGVKRSYSATRSHVPSPLRDVVNEQSQRPPIQRSSSSRSYSKSGSSSHSPSNPQYSGPGTGQFHPHFLRPCIDVTPRPPLPDSFPK
jgi:hypothetical protein